MQHDVCCNVALANTHSKYAQINFNVALTKLNVRCMHAAGMAEIPAAGPPAADAGEKEKVVTLARDLGRINREMWQEQLDALAPVVRATFKINLLQSVCLALPTFRKCTYI